MRVCLFFTAKVNRVLLIEFMHKFNNTSTHKNKFNHGKIVKFCTLAQNLTIPPKMELRMFFSKSHTGVLPCFLAHHFIRNEILYIKPLYVKRRYILFINFFMKIIL